MGVDVWVHPWGTWHDPVGESHLVWSRSLDKLPTSAHKPKRPPSRDVGLDVRGGALDGMRSAGRGVESSVALGASAGETQ